MTLEVHADRLAYIQAFGEPVRCDAGTFCAIFDNGFLGVPAGDMEVEESGPRLTCRTCDVETIRKDAALDVGGKTYRVQRKESDGTGMTVIILRE